MLEKNYDFTIVSEKIGVKSITFVMEKLIIESPKFKIKKILKIKSHLVLKKWYEMMDAWKNYVFSSIHSTSGIICGNQNNFFKCAP